MESPFAFVPPCSFTTQSHILSSKSFLVDLGQAWRRSHATKRREGCIPPRQSISCCQNQMSPPLPPPPLQTIMTSSKTKNLRTRRRKPIPQDNDWKINNVTKQAEYKTKTKSQRYIAVSYLAKDCKLQTVILRLSVSLFFLCADITLIFPKL